MENKTTQLRKGILELAILGALSRGRHYGYSLVRTIAGSSGIDLTEGTIYPILARLAKEGLVRSEWVESSQGPPRKYYTLTPKGEEAFRILDEEFRKLASMVANAAAAPAAADTAAGLDVIDVAKETDNA
jgi:PadR family transcriptional regulator, regulatory protein PadR